VENSPEDHIEKTNHKKMSGRVAQAVRALPLRFKLTVAKDKQNESTSGNWDFAPTRLLLRSLPESWHRGCINLQLLIFYYYYLFIYLLIFVGLGC
jgi:hypothetical protein